MYVLAWESAKLNVCQVAKSNNDLSWEWNHKLNHLNFKAITRGALVEGLLNMTFNKHKICETCQKGRQIKSSFE